MPCTTTVMVNLEDTRWNRLAREKLKLNAKGQLTEQQANEVRLEAGKLKTAAVVKALNPSSVITGMQVGSDELQIQMNLEDF